MMSIHADKLSYLRMSHLNVLLYDCFSWLILYVSILLAYNVGILRLFFNYVINLCYVKKRLLLRYIQVLKRKVLC